MDLLPPALQFLPSTKTREVDHVLRQTHLETLLLLCTTRWGRDYLRANGVYPLIREMHKTEPNDGVSPGLIPELGQYLNHSFKYSIAGGRTDRATREFPSAR